MTSEAVSYPGRPRSDRDVLLVGPVGQHVTGHLAWTRLGLGSYRVVLDGPTGPVEATNRDFFDALVDLRRQLEPLGWSISVQGARRDTYPSGMLRDAGARRVYVQTMGEQVRRDRMPPIFDDADPADLGTVDEQADYHHRWRESVFGPRSD